MEEFFGLLFTIILIFLILRWLFRLFLPYIIRYLAGRFQKRIAKSFKQHQNTKDFQNYQSTENQKPKEKKKVGEYIDFEELD